MSIETLKAALPDYAKDLKLNLGSVLNAPELTPQQAWGSAVAAALAARNPHVIRAIADEAAEKIAPEALAAAKTAHAIMAMNNIYYRATHLISNPDYGTMRAGLRMNALATHGGVAQVDFELYSIAVSAINGCGMCLDSHEKVVTSKGATKEAVQAVLKIAAVVHGVAITLEGHAVLDGGMAQAAE